VPLPDDHEERGVYILEGSVSVAGQSFEAGQMMAFRPKDRISLAAGLRARGSSFSAGRRSPGRATSGGISSRPAGGRSTPPRSNGERATGAVASSISRRTIATNSSRCRVERCVASSSRSASSGTADFENRSVGTTEMLPASAVCILGFANEMNARRDHRPARLLETFDLERDDRSGGEERMEFVGGIIELQDGIVAEPESDEAIGLRTTGAPKRSRNMATVSLDGWCGCRRSPP
jgi:hypothetical protein